MQENLNFTATTDMKDINQKILHQARKIRGYLHKQSYNIFVGYQKRFFLIIQQNLVYFIDESLEQPRGYIALANIKNLKSSGDVEFNFKYFDRIFYLRAQNTEKRDEWINSLNISIFFMQNNQEKEFILRDLPLRLKKKDTMRKLRSLVDIELQNKNKQSTEQCWPKQIMKELNLYKLYEEFDSDKIKNRIIFIRFNEGQYFLISCKSLNKNYEDQQILKKDYVEPYDFNVFYQYNKLNQKNQKNRVQQVYKASQIQTIEIIDDKYLKINNYLFMFEEEYIEQFVDKLRNAIIIGKQYHNELNISLKKNIESIINSYEQCKDGFQREQTIKMKVQETYSKILSKYDKNYKSIGHIYIKLLDELFEQVKNIIDAFIVKTIFKEDILINYLQFFNQKIIQNLKHYWNQNYDSIQNLQILALSSWIYKYCALVKQFLSVTHLENNVKVINKIFIRNSIEEFRNQIKKILQNSKVFEISIANTTKIPYEFSKIIQKTTKEILKSDNIEDSNIKIEGYIIRSYKVLSHIILQIIQKENNTKILISLCNDIWMYKILIKQIKDIDLRDINTISNNIHKKLSKKISEIIFRNLSFSNTFFKIQVIELCKIVLKKIQGYETLHQMSSNEIKLKAIQQLFGMYFKRLITSITSESISFAATIQKIQADSLKFSELYTQILEKEVPISQKVSKAFQCILYLLKEQDLNKLTQYFVWLRTNFLANYISYQQVQILFSLRYMSQSNRKKKLEICKFIFTQQETRNNRDQQIDMQDQKQERNSLLSRISYLSNQMSNITSKSASVEGYLERKIVTKLRKEYQKRYFRIVNENLVWYMTFVSTDIINSLRVEQIGKIYKHDKYENKFFIQMYNGVIHKFKAIASSTCKNWIETLLKCKKQIQKKSKKNPEYCRQTTLMTNSQQPIFVDYLHNNHKFFDNQQHSERNKSIISLQNVRPSSTKIQNCEKSQKDQAESYYELISPRKKNKPKVSFWKKLTCIRIEEQ